MAMEEMFGSWGFLIVLLLFIWFIWGNNRGNQGMNDAEKQEIIDSAQTQYRVIEENRRSTDMLSAQMRGQWD
jgi:hypothetical protein